MQEKQRIIFALILSALFHLFVWSCLPQPNKKNLQPLPVSVFEAELVQVNVSKLTKTVAYPPVPELVLTSPLPGATKNEAVVAVPIEAMPIPTRPAESKIVSTEVTEPRYKVSYLNNPAPEYPLLARRRGLEGSVLLHVQVLSDGNSATVNVKMSSGHVLLDKSAQATVRRWRFMPAMQGNEAVSAWVEVPIVFKLER